MSAFHGAIYCLAPTRIVLWGATIVFFWVPFFFPQAIGLAIHPWSVFGIGIGVLLFFFAYPLLLLALEGVPWKYYPRYFLMFIFGPTWVIAAGLGFLRRKNTHWDKTEHTRSLSIGEVERVRGREPGLEARGLARRRPGSYTPALWQTNPTKTKPKWNVLALVAFAGSLLWVPVCAFLALKDGHAPPAAISAIVSAVLGLGLGSLARRQIDKAPTHTYRGRSLASSARLLGWIAILVAAGIIFWLLLPDHAPVPGA